MEKNQLFDDYYQENFMQGGSTCCPGCGGPLFWKISLKLLGPNTVVYGGGPCAGCAARQFKLPKFKIYFSFVADGSTGIVNALAAKGREDVTVVSAAGDGGVGDLGFGKVSAAAERNENMLQICIDNEAYMNTGIQKSGLTPYGAWTTTTPLGKVSAKKDVTMILAQHKIPYAATVSVSHIPDLEKKVLKAKDIKGFRYLHNVMPCPTGWRFPTAKSIEVIRLGVETWAWPLYEIDDGVLRLTVKPKQRPLREYLEAQARFRHLTEEQIEAMQAEVDARRDRLLENDGRRIIL